MKKKRQTKKPVKKKNGRPKGPPPSEKVDLKLVTRAKKAGLTDKQLAGILGLSERTILYYKLDPKFTAAYKKGKEHAVGLVAQTLFVRAQGYNVDEVTIEDGRLKKIVRKHIPGDVGAAVFFLKNQDPVNWKDRREVTGADGKDLIPTKDPYRALAELLDKNGITVAEALEPATGSGSPGDDKENRLEN